CLVKQNTRSYSSICSATFVGGSSPDFVRSLITTIAVFHPSSSSASSKQTAQLVVLSSVITNIALFFSTITLLFIIRWTTSSKVVIYIYLSYLMLSLMI